MNYIEFTWKQFNESVEKLTQKIKRSNLIFDGIYGVPRGGLPLAVALSHTLKLPLLLNPSKDSLVVDDISDNGDTLLHMKNKRIATLVSTEWTISPPDYTDKYKRNRKDWIVFPWEEIELN